MKSGPNCTREKTNIWLQDLIRIPHSSYNASCKDIEVYAANQCDACPDLRYCNGRFLGHWRACRGSLALSIRCTILFIRILQYTDS
ncbi:hypothetical protein TNCV_2512681 [Trichonephila clavipes]|nr:hypothetical protein TNCV_2512681 [Trichonephila clavipes]